MARGIICQIWCFGRRRLPEAVQGASGTSLVAVAVSTTIIRAIGERCFVLLGLRHGPKGRRPFLMIRLLGPDEGSPLLFFQIIFIITDITTYTIREITCFLIIIQ